MKISTMMRLLLISLLLLVGISVSAQGEPLAPPEIPGQAYYVAFPVAITPDGNLSDWSGIPLVTVARDISGRESFTFGLAAEGSTLYVLMTAKDDNIITGQHEGNFWNEDSLEFYINLTGDYLRGSYTAGIHQININPGDIGKMPGDALTITGSGSSGLPVEGAVFATEDGWGFEASVSLPEPVVHGGEIGFQAHGNGATTLDRDFKLIWSADDINDTSYTDPSKFGRALFFEIGQTDIPQPSEVVIVPVIRDFIAVNQLGYLPESPKHAVFAVENAVIGGPIWVVRNVESGAMVLAGTILKKFEDAASGDVIYPIDFSALTEPGTYVIEVNGATSAPFTVANDLYAALADESLRYFYRTRSGIELTDAYAGADFARPAGHLSDGQVTCWSGQANGQDFPACDYILNGAGGWYDAGDYGKYVVNGGIAAWTLQNLAERFPAAYPDGALPLPESGAGVSDILSEARWEVDWMMRMQVPEGQDLAGMVHHKLHETQWSGLPLMPETNTDNLDPVRGRLLMPVSTAATLNMAATAAQAARLWRDTDPVWADTALGAAEKAWAAANLNPDITYGSIPGAGGGDYPDSRLEDEFFWAAAELYISTGSDVYRDYLMASSYLSTARSAVPDATSSAMYWGDTEALGALSLLSAPNGLPAEALDKVRGDVITTANRYLSIIDAEGYRVPFGLDGYVWGSNSGVLNNAIILAVAHDLTGDARYLNGVIDSMNYVLGMNANDISFVSGFGTRAMQHPHHRFWANQPENGYPAPPPGVIAGGPNGAPADPAAIAAVSDVPTARRYIDDIESYSTNEVAINWNAPLVWVAAYLATR